MATSVTARSLLAGLALTVATVPLHAQRVAAGVAVHRGPVSAHVIVRDGYDEGYSTYRRPVTRRVIVVERPRVLVVERVHRHYPPRHWTRRGYHPVTVYYWDGRYYDRRIGYRPGVREVVVWERDGRYYHQDYDRDRDHRHDHDCDDDRWEH
jgi:hypothetical protein